MTSLKRRAQALPTATDRGLPGLWCIQGTMSLEKAKNLLPVTRTACLKTKWS